MPGTKKPRKKQGHPRLTQPRPTPVRAEDAFPAAVYGTLQATLALVQEAEILLLEKIRHGEDVEEIREVHLLLRSSAAGLYFVHTALNPDPKEAS